MADSSLVAIRVKVRRLTRSPSSSQITDAQIDEYINTFVLYDLPEHLRLFTLRTTLTFFTDPFVDVYGTNTTDPTDPLFQFKDRFITTHKPIYIAGFPTFLSQSREQFFGIYPLTNSISTIGTNGDGVTTNFAGTISPVPVLRDNVLFSSIDSTNNGLTLSDDGEGVLSGDGTGTIDYITGDFTLAFSVAPGAGEEIDSQTIPYVAARPQAILYFDNKFTLRPVPDKPYTINLEVYKRPTELLQSAQIPELEQWWQYIAYGASKKILEDRVDLETVALLMPEYKQQERLVLRRTIVQQTNERSATIYTEQTSLGGGFNWWTGGGSF